MKRRIIAICICIVVVVVAAAGVLIGRPMWAERCAASFEEVPVADLANFRGVPLDQVEVGNYPKEHRDNVRNLLEVAQHPIAPLGPTRNAVVVPHQLGEAAAHLANSNDGEVRFEVGGSRLIGTTTYAAIVQPDGETGKPVWGRRQVGYNADGGDPAGRMVLTYNPTNKALRIAAVNTGNGDLAWCTKLGEDKEGNWIPATDSVMSGDTMFVARSSDPDGDVRLFRIDARSGKLGWDKPVTELNVADSVHVLRDQVLLSPAQPRRADLTTLRGAVVASSAADGGATWSYRGPDDRGWFSNVVGTGRDVAVVVSRRASSQGKRLVNEAWMMGVDRTGQQLWKHEVKNQFADDLSSSFKVAGDLVLSYERAADKAGPSTLVARSLTDGTERWRTPLTTTGSPLRRGASEVLGSSLLANTYDDGLIAVDLGTGAVTNPLPGKKIGPIDRIVSDARTVTIDANGLFITFNRAS